MPKAEDGRMGFVTVDDYFELRFKETVHWQNDDVEGEDDKVSLLSSPLKVVFRANLYRGRVSEGSGDDQFIVRNME